MTARIKPQQRWKTQLSFRIRLPPIGFRCQPPLKPTNPHLGYLPVISIPSVWQLLSALDQPQQLQALAESRYQTEHQQLAGMRTRSVLQRLRAVFVADRRGIFAPKTGVPFWPCHLGHLSIFPFR